MIAARATISLLEGLFPVRVREGRDYANHSQVSSDSFGTCQSDRRFRDALLTGAVNELLAGDLQAGKAMLRDYVNATITFDGLAEA